MKWNANNIVEFLIVYQQCPVLWNVKDKAYGNTKFKDEIFQRLFTEVEEKELIGGMSVKQLKAKIKSIKDVYRQELHKIEKSKRSGYGTKEVHSPKLAWFSEANYLAEVLATRSSKSNLISEEKPYDQFGKLVASELRQLPQRQAILLQQEIQNCIIRSKLPSFGSCAKTGLHLALSKEK